MRWDAPQSIEELHKPLQRDLQDWESDLAYTFTIECANTGTFIGRIFIIKYNEVDHVWTLGLWTHPQQQRKGYMTEAAKAIVEFGFTVLEAERIEASYALWNTGSEKVLKRIGMTFVRYIPQRFQKRGEWVEANLLAIERKDWKASKET